VLNFFDLVLGVGTATEDLGAFPAVRVDPACLITAIAKFADMSHLDHDPSCLGLTQISASGAFVLQPLVVDLGRFKVCSRSSVDLSSAATPMTQSAAPGVV
jgi:hypothetical protein